MLSPICLIYCLCLLHRDNSSAFFCLLFLKSNSCGWTQRGGTWRSLRSALCQFNNGGPGAGGTEAAESTTKPAQSSEVWILNPFECLTKNTG